MAERLYKIIVKLSLRREMRFSSCFDRYQQFQDTDVLKSPH